MMLSETEELRRRNQALENEVARLREQAATAQRYRAIFDSTTDFAIIVSDPNGHVTDWNIGAERILGWSTEEMVGEHTAVFFTPEDRATGRVEEEMRLAREAGRAGDERWHLRNDGSRFWASGEMMLLRDAGGVHLGYLKILRDRTDEHRAGEALQEAEVRLRESEDHLRHTVELNPQVPWTCDPEGNITSYSQRWLDLTGQAPGEPDGAGWTKALHPDDLPHTIAVFSACLASGEPVDVDYRIRVAAAGEYRWMRARAYPRRNAVGEIIHWYGLVEDVHDRRLAEARLRANEEQFRVFAQSVPNHVWAGRPDGYLDWFNDQVYAYCGEAPGTLYGTTEWTRIVHPEDLPAAGEAWTRSLTTGEVYETEFRIRRADGAYRWFLVRAEPVWGADDRIVRWVGTNTDIDDQRRQGAELERLNATLAQEVAKQTQDRDRIWRLSPVLKVIGTMSGDILAVNPAWTHTLGWSEEDTLGRNVMEFVAPEDREIGAAAIQQLVAGQPMVEFQSTFATKDGGQRRIAWTTMPEEGTLYGFGRDVTEQRTIEEALRQSQKMEAVGQLTGGIAHDFNNMLAGISGSLELMQSRMTQGRFTEIDRYVSAAQGAAKRAAALTHRLLAFSRRQTLDPRPTDVNRLIAGMEELVRRTIGPEIALEVVGAGGLWPALVDPSQLENALLNLCINARDAMPEGGRITIETANKWLDQRGARQHDMPPGQYLSLCVSDTGTGMPPNVIARAFEPFFTTKPIGEGTGLGLSMIYGFAKQSGGQVRIYSEVGQGTTVCIYLPRHFGGIDTDDPLANLDVAPRAEHGETVLVVDDEPTVRMLVTEVLEDLGYTAIEAADSMAGLKVLQSDVRLDLLITDVGLPGGINGRQMADAGRIARPDLKVLFITGYAENAVVGNGHLDHGMQVLTKPFVMEMLATRIRELIGA
ncbi:Blue-light-activated protein [Methylobacterium brachiatum]|nr:Blue-light-activated protein [Methylobacterium brachiatum]